MTDPAANVPAMTTDPGISRRRAIGGLAAAAGAAWAVPTFVTIPAAAALSCTVTGVTWSDYDTTIDDYPAAWPFMVPLGGSSDLTVDLDLAGLGAGSANAGYATIINPLGGETTSYIVVELDPASAPGDYVELVLTFSNPVVYAAFTLLDLDRGDGRWQDRVELRATYLAAPVNSPTITLGGPDLTTVAIAGGDRITATNDPSGIGDGVDNNTTAGNVAIGYGVADLLDEIRIRYIAGPDEPTPQLQQIGLTDLTFCLYE